MDPPSVSSDEEEDVSFGLSLPSFLHTTSPVLDANLRRHADGPGHTVDRERQSIVSDKMIRMRARE